MELINHVASIYQVTIMAVALVISVAAIGTAVAFAMLGGRFLDNTARQPEMASMLQTKFFILAGLIDAVSMIGIGVALWFSTANPFVVSFLQQASQLATA